MALLLQRSAQNKTRCRELLTGFLLTQIFDRVACPLARLGALLA